MTASVLTISEAKLQEAVVDLAHTFGWVVAHFRPARTERGWRTPVAADGAGFFDLVLMRERVIFAELKSDRGKLRPEQEAWRASAEQAGAEYYLWTPTCWRGGVIEKALRWP